MSETLKPCPFCGGKAFITQGKTKPCQMHGERMTVYTVQCKHKDAKWKNNSTLPECFVKPKVTGVTKEGAAKMWNARSPAEDGGCQKCKPIIERLEFDIAVKKSWMETACKTIERLEKETHKLFSSIVVDDVKREVLGNVVPHDRRTMAGKSIGIFICKSIDYLAEQGYLWKQEPIPKSQASHEWEKPDGERCVKCGDKDWFAGPICSESKIHPTPPPCEALEALEAWVCDPDRFTMPFGELTAAEKRLCDAAETIRTALSRPSVNGILDPDMPDQELRLHMGELTANEMLVARAAIRWANDVGEKNPPICASESGVAGVVTDSIRENEERPRND